MNHLHHTRPVAIIHRDISSVSILLQGKRKFVDDKRETTQWSVSRGEIALTYKVLGRGAWGCIVEGIFRGSQVAVKEMHHVLVS